MSETVFNRSVNNSQALRRRLLDLGYEPVVCAGKRPVETAWQEGQVTAEQLDAAERRHPGATNTGIRTGAVTVVDLDLSDPHHADAVGSWVELALGPSPYRRVGAKPGGALLYRSSEPMGKITVKGVPPGSPTGAKPEKIEFLGTGQQVIVAGVHPDTGRPFTWPGSDIADAPLSELPEVAPSDIRHAAELAAAALRNLDYREVSISEAGAGRGDGGSAAHGEPVTNEMLRDMLARVDPGCDRNTWVAVCGALRSANVVTDDGEPDPEHDGLALFTEWSGGELHEGEAPANFVGTEDCDKTWGSLRADRAAGAGVGSLIFLARKGGWKGSTMTPAAMWGEPDGASDAVVEEASAASRRRFAPRSEAEQDDRPPPRWLVKGVIQERTNVLIYAPENSYKSFGALDLGLSGSAGIPWAAGAGHPGYAPDRPLTVVYIAGEGCLGIEKKRRPAWRHHHRIDRPLPFYTIDAMPQLAEPGEVAALIDDIEAASLRPDMIVIDTAARAMVGLDENSARDVGRFVAGCDRLRDHFGAAVVVVHHSGKDPRQGARGSSALTAAFDCRFRVSADLRTTALKIEHEKQKDAEPIGTVSFRGAVVRPDPIDQPELSSLVFERSWGERTVERSESIEEEVAAVLGMADGEMTTPELARGIVDRRRRQTTRLSPDSGAGDDPGAGQTTRDDSQATNAVEAVTRQLQRGAKDENRGELREMIVSKPLAKILRWGLGDT